ncbi:MAG TPA: hypothetical protein VGX00_02050 [Thermoplasmata archaeon]|nr:hypothetical protein [Thermoplasmata archaeon]
MVPLEVMRGRIEAMPHWAGTSVDAVHEPRPAADIIAELVRDAESHLLGSLRPPSGATP